MADEYVRVPRKLTGEMRRAMRNVIALEGGYRSGLLDDIYNAMLAHLPAAAPADQEKVDAERNDPVPYLDEIYNAMQPKKVGSETPRTDAQLTRQHGGIWKSMERVHGHQMSVPAHFARQLERELASVRKEAMEPQEDAKRYRFLKQCDDWFQFQGYIECEPEGLDKAIDAARSLAEGGK